MPRSSARAQAKRISTDLLVDNMDIHPLTDSKEGDADKVDPDH